jgi:beta-galactosidase
MSAFPHKTLRARRAACVLAMAAAAAWAGAAPVGQETASAVPRFAVVGDHFELDGQPYQIRSGDIHYTRIPRQYWRDRLRKARAMGLNTIQTYVFWNAHEPAPGKFDFSGNLDVAAFVLLAQEEGLNVIVRPGPYICTEWEFGGFPAWLLRQPGMVVRGGDARFLQASAAYMKRVGQELAPLQSTRGGPIIMVQVENEYGSFGADHSYMAAIHDQVKAAGFDVPLFTSDGPSDGLLKGGTLPGITSVVNFSGSARDAAKSFEAFARFRSGVPRMVGEYWTGWFDHWGEKHHVTDAAAEADAVDWMLGQGISVNLYMFHGGTSFGYMAGANFGEHYAPDTTSYDYDGQLDEAGRPTKKYYAFRDMLRKHLAPGETLPEVPTSAATIAIPRFALQESVTLLEALPALGRPVTSRQPLKFEELNQNYGFVLYRKRLERDITGFKVDDLRDYASVLGNGLPVGTLDRRKDEKELRSGLKAGTTLDLLVENMGRVNFDQKMVDERKGIFGAVTTADGAPLEGWQSWSLPLGDLARLKFTRRGSTAGPTFWRGSFELKQVSGDTFVDTRGWGKGHVWVNGHHLGRYWKIGPQQTLYLPAPWLRAGRNEVIVLDVESAQGPHTLQGLQDPVFDTPGGAHRQSGD